MVNSRTMKFLCDAMLGRLGRLLRMAGYDTVIETGTTLDRDLVEKALREDRLFLTRDKSIQEIKNSEIVLIYLPDSDEASWTRLLSDRYHVDWLHAPFTRCLECNSLLMPLPLEARNLAPADIERILYCPTCRQAFWDGSHVERMKKYLEELNRGTRHAQ